MFKAFLLSLFVGPKSDDDLKPVREAARQDAQRVIGTYADTFEAEAARVLADRRQRFISADPNIIETTCEKPRRKRSA